MYYFLMASNKQVVESGRGGVNLSACPVDDGNYLAIESRADPPPPARSAFLSLCPPPTRHLIVHCSHKCSHSHYSGLAQRTRGNGRKMYRDSQVLN